VGVVEVDAVSAHPAQALLDLLDDVAARQSRGGVETTLPRLGGEHHLVAATSESAEEILGRALGHYERLGIDIHGVLNGPR
jgi:hypothetical protein